MMKVTRSRRLRAPLMLLALAAAFALSSCGSDDGATDVPVTVPRITGLSSAVLEPGDTLAIAGSGFASPASSNLVAFNNSLAVVPPYSATDTTLYAVVPQNANSGPMHVSSKGVTSNAVEVTIQRSVGDVWVMAGGSAFEFTVPAPTGAEEYLLVAESATATGSPYAFNVYPDVVAAAEVSPSDPSPRPTGRSDFALDFEAKKRREVLEYLRAHAGRAEDLPEALSVPAEPQDTRQFYVLKSTECSAANPDCYARVTATLEYTGAHALIYADQNQPTGSFSPADYEAFGQQFDAQIYPVDSSFFGDPTDIDHNGKIIILFTPVVNDLTPDGQAALGGFIAGFVLLSDLAPNVFPATSNGAEIFYSMVPDPNGEYGNVFPKSIIDGVVPGILAHEFEHMISNGHRFVVLGGGTNPAYIQETWLEEGMAHMAEDLNGMDEQNIRRADLYLDSPALHSLLGNAELRPNAIDTLEQRGGIFLFLRYLADRYGEDILKSIVQSRNLGIGAVEAVTGASFHASINDYLACLYLSGRGISDDPRYEYASLDIQNDFDGPTVTVRSAAAGAFGASVRSATGNFFHVTGATPPTLRIRVSSTSPTANMRVVITRIR